MNSRMNTFPVEIMINNTAKIKVDIFLIYFRKSINMVYQSFLYNCKNSCFFVVVYLDYLNKSVDVYDNEVPWYEYRYMIQSLGRHAVILVIDI